MQKLFFLPLVFGVIISTAKAQLLNTPAPLLVFNNLLQNPQKVATAENLKGKTIVLEFWATWCTPCMANLAHLNQVQAHFANDSNVVFISVTDEPQAKVERFLQKRKMNGWVATDGKEVLNAYKINALPHTFIIDKTGRIVYDGRPEKLDTTLVRAVHTGTFTAEETAQGKNRDEIPLGGWSPGEDPVFTANFSVEKGKLIPYQHTIRKSVVPFPGGGYGWRSTPEGGVGVTLLSITMEDAMAILLNLPSAHRITNHSVYKNEKWDIIFSRDKGYDMDKAFGEIAQSFKTALSISAKDTVLAIDAFTATLTNNAQVINEAEITEDDPAAKSYKSIAELLALLEEKKEMVVVYDFDAATKYFDTFEIANSIYTMDAAGLENWLKGKGLAFKTEKRQVKLLWVH